MTTRPHGWPHPCDCDAPPGFLCGRQDCERAIRANQTIERVGLMLSGCPEAIRAMLPPDELARRTFDLARTPPPWARS